MDQKYSIFISYRRDGGESTAKILRDKLSEMGYQVFFDVESLRSGDFNTALYSVIDECEDFILVLSPGALDRCQNEKDWVRLEIEHALAAGKNIIPVMLRGFTFPELLPESMESLPYKNGLEPNYQFFDAFMEKLKTFLKSEAKDKSTAKKRKFRRWIPVIAGFILIVFAGGLFFVIKNRQSVYPKTSAEQNITKDFLAYVQLNMQQMEYAAGYLDESYQACEQYLLHEDTASRDDLLAELKQKRSFLYQMDVDSCQMSPELYQYLMESPFSLSDAAAMDDYLITFRDSCIDNIYYMEYLTDPENYIDDDVKEDIISNYREILTEEMKTAAYDTNLLLLPITSEEAIYDFKREFLPQLYYIPLQASSWSTDEDVLLSNEERSLNTISKILDRIVSQVGEDNMKLMQTKSELVQQLIEGGYTEKEAKKEVEELGGDINALTAAQEDVNAASRELEAKLEEARKKFAPAEGDDGGILWSKMLRFLNIGLYEDAIICVDAYRETMRDTDEYTDEYCAAAVRFITNISKTGIDYGLMVVGYEPDMPQNEQYEIGDVIIAVEGVPCHNFEEYSSLKDPIGEEAYSVTILRAKEDGSGELEAMTLQIPADASRVLIMAMSEKDY